MTPRNTRSLLFSIVVLAVVFVTNSVAFAKTRVPVGNTEYIGQLKPQLLAHSDDTDKVVFKPVDDLSKVKFDTPVDPDAHVTGARLYHPQQDKSSILALVVESEGDDPQLFVDLDMNKTIADGERFTFKRGEEDNPYVWNLTINLPIEGKPFTTFPIFVQYLKNVRAEGLRPEDRYIQQSKVAFAQGTVDVKGRQILVQYAFNAQTKKISAESGELGVDGNGDGVIEMDNLSPESTMAQEETVIFRVGDSYLSTKKVDVEKNQIVVREHSASDYKRIEVRMGGELPDFSFTDVNGKKRKFSEFRGKYVLLDFWGFWCPACREEAPYLIAAYKRFQSRGLEILGMNSDTSMEVSELASNLKRNNMLWPQATILSIKDVVINMRIRSWPTTMLLGPDGKILSLGRQNSDQPQLRGRELIKTLDDLLPAI